MIPGLEEAEFFRYGVMHRNTFLDAPRVLDGTFALKGDRRVRFAGQITGTEGYTEALATGLLAAMNTYADLCGRELEALPGTGALGSLVAYATSPETPPSSIPTPSTSRWSGPTAPRPSSAASR